MTCGAGCSEQGGDGVGKLEKTLNALADIDTEELLKALNEMNQEQKKGECRWIICVLPFSILRVDLCSCKIVGVVGFYESI